MKLVPIILFLCLSCQITWGQSKTDSLLKQLQFVESEKGKADLLLQISSECIRTDPSKTFDYAKQAAEVCREAAYQEGLGNAFRYMGISHAIKGHFPEARQYYDLALEAFEGTEDHKGIAATYYAKAITFDATGSYDQATEIYNHALTIQRSSGDSSGMANTYTGIGNMMKKISEFDRSLSYYDSAATIYEQIGDVDNMALILHNRSNIYLRKHNYLSALKAINSAIAFNDSLDRLPTLSFNYLALGNLYLQLDENEEAKKNLLKSLNIRKHLGMTKGMAICITNLGHIDQKLGNYDSAIFKFHQAIKLYDSLGMKCEKPITEGLIGEMYLEQKQYDSAQLYLENALRGGTECQRDVALAPANLFLGKLYMQKGKSRLAEKYFLNVINLKSQQETTESVRDAAYQLYHIYKDRQQNSKSLKHLEIYSVIQDSLITKEKSLGIARLEARYTFEKEKESLNQLHKQDLENKQAEIDRTNIYNISLIVITLLSFSVFTLALILYTKSQRHNKELKTNADKLESASRTNEKLLAIISHDIRTPLSSLDTTISLLNSEDLNPREFMALLDRISTDVKNLLLLLENVTKWSRARENDLSARMHEFDLIASIKECTALLKPFADQKGITIDLESDKAMLVVKADKDMIQVVCRNLLSNAIKFSPENGNIQMSLAESENMIHFKIKDEGTGMDQSTREKLFSQVQTPTRGTKNESGTGIGLYLCNEFIKKHRGTIDVQSELGKGTTISISMPSKG